MTDQDLTGPDRPPEPTEKEKELLKDARKSKAEAEAKQSEALAEIAKGEELEQFEVIQLGDLEIEVKAWIPGDTTNTVERAMSLAESEDPEKMRRSMETMIQALADMTTDEDYDLSFWRAYYDKYGPTGMQPAVNKILGPALKELEQMRQREVDEERLDAANGFRTDGQGRIVRSGDGNDGEDAPRNP